MHCYQQVGHQFHTYSSCSIYHPSFLDQHQHTQIREGAQKIVFVPNSPTKPQGLRTAEKKRKIAAFPHTQMCTLSNAMEDVGEEGGQQCRPSRSESLIQSDRGQFDTGYYYYNYYYYYNDYYYYYY